MKRKQIKVGMLVRVGRDNYHGIRFGGVCRVTEVFDDGDCYVDGPTMPGWDQRGQAVAQSLCKPAKQASK